MRSAHGLLLLSTPVLFMGSEYEKAISFGELYEGLRKSSRNVKWKDSVATYYANGLKNTYKLRQDLLGRKYAIDPYQRFQIHEPKEREIVATRIKDRQFQRSLCDNVLYPQLTRSFIRDNCACQRGKGVDDALDRMDAHLRRYYHKHGVDGWVLKCDIHHYFAETRHEDAKAAVRKRVKDDDAYDRAAEIIDSFGGEKGIGLGSQVSQLVELALLDDFDHWIKERLGVKHYIRYMDDFILIHSDKAFLEECLRQVAERLARLGLTLNAKTHIHPLRQGVMFLKWRFILTSSGKVVRRMSKQSITKERRKLKKLQRRVLDGKCTLDDMRTNFESWKANAERGNTHGIVIQMETYFNKLIREVSENGNCGQYSAEDCTDDRHREEKRDGARRADV